MRLLILSFLLINISISSCKKPDATNCNISKIFFDSSQVPIVIISLTYNNNQQFVAIENKYGQPWATKTNLSDVTYNGNTITVTNRTNKNNFTTFELGANKLPVKITSVYQNYLGNSSQITYEFFYTDSQLDSMVSFGGDKNNVQTKWSTDIVHFNNSGNIDSITTIPHNQINNNPTVSYYQYDVSDNYWRKADQLFYVYYGDFDFYFTSPILLTQIFSKNNTTKIYYGSQYLQTQNYITESGRLVKVNYDEYLRAGIRIEYDCK